MIFASFSAQKGSLTSRLGAELGCCSCSVLQKGTENSLDLIHIKKKSNKNLLLVPFTKPSLGSILTTKRKLSFF